MHVFCPDCNAEYKVNERSSLTKTIKFVCIECESSWIDKFEKLEQAKREVYASQEFNSDVVIENKNKEIGTVELNSLALEEAQHSFGNNNNSSRLKNNNTESEHIFHFETSEVNNEIGIEGPSKTFPKIRSNKESHSDKQIEERDAKEIEIEKRLKESSELLKKAKQPHIENNETIKKGNMSKSRIVLVLLSILLIFSFFSYNLTILFLEDILKKVPFAPEILSQISKYTTIFQNILLLIFESIRDFIPNLV